MPMRFNHAIVRLPAASLARGLTRHDLGAPDVARALLQHAAYCAALRDCGLQVRTLAADVAFPDCCFIEDTAILLPRAAMLCRPGADSRQGEVASVREALAARFPVLAQISAPGTVDGGDVCVAGARAFIGVSARTNAAGAEQLSEWFGQQGLSARIVDIRTLVETILHLKSGLTWLGDERLLLIDALASHPAFADFERVPVDAREGYAANAVRINDHVLIADGFPKLEGTLDELGYRTIALDMSEFAKLDGGLSCLSLRW